jgi:predicted nucleic acid-binding protein
MISYALDTNIVSYFLKGNQKIIDCVRSEMNTGNKIVIIPLVYYEIKKWLTVINFKTKLLTFNKMYSTIKPIDEENLDIAISIYYKLRKKGKIVGDSDILIAAYCVKYNLTLVTNNIKHFEDIENLQTVNWME